jgi:general secretion pathway protein A
MYESFFGLKEKPFAMPPDPRFLFWSDSHRRAYSMLDYGIFDNVGFTVITGEIGSGKTTLLRQLINTLGPGVTVGVLNNTRIQEGDLLRWVMMVLGQPFEQPSYIALLRDFQKFLIDEYAKLRRTILVVDEAQNLSIGTLEELRMLSNINAEGMNVLQIVLVGQPQLRDLLPNPDLKQLVQRIGSDFHLAPLSAMETAAYIDHRLAAVGGWTEIFSPEAKALIAFTSAGVPRIINSLCDRSLLYAFSAGTKVVSEELVKTMLKDRETFSPFRV